MSKFAGIRTAGTSQGGNYFKPGIYSVSVKEVKMITSRQKDDLFIVECEVLKSTHEDIIEGMTTSWVVNMKHDASLGNIKLFMAAALGESEDKIDEDTCDFAVSPENPLKNTLMELECVATTTRAGGNFTKHNWASAE